MQQSSLSNKSIGSISGNQSDTDKKLSQNVNWISVINFLESEYTKSTLQQKQWFLQKKLLNQEILKLKNQLTAVETLNCNLNNRIKLLEITLRKQKLMKSETKEKFKSIQQSRTIEEIQKYFQKNGWNLSEKPKTFQQTAHKQFLNKVLDEVGLNFNTISEKCRKLSLISVQTEKLQKQDKVENFHVLIDELSKVKISSKIKINAHLDAVRGLFTTKNTQSQNLVVSVSEDCLVKSWNVDTKVKDKNEAFEPISSFRQHTGQLFTIDGGQNNQNDLTLFTTGTQDCIKIWHTAAKDKPQNIKCIGSFINENNSNQQRSPQLQNEIIWSLKYKDEKLLTSASDGVVRLFKTSIQSKQNKIVPEIKFLTQFNQKGYLHSAIEWVGNRAFLAACSNSPRIHLWDLQRSKLVQKFLYEIEKVKDDKTTLKKDNNFINLFQINSVKYNSEARSIYAACEDKAVRIFSYGNAKINKKLDNGINDAINCLQIYKSNFIAAGCQDGTLKIWDQRTYKLLIDEQAHRTKYNEGILCMKATDQGIFTGGADGIINFYTI